jgi:hypothetical protein
VGRPTNEYESAVDAKIAVLLGSGRGTTEKSVLVAVEGRICDSDVCGRVRIGEGLKEQQHQKLKRTNSKKA